MRTMILVLLLAATAAGDSLYVLGPQWQPRRENTNTFWQYADGTIKRKDCDGYGYFGYLTPVKERCICLDNLDDYYVLRVDTTEVEVVPKADEFYTPAIYIVKTVYDTLWAPLIVGKFTPQQWDKLVKWLDNDGGCRAPTGHVYDSLWRYTIIDAEPAIQDMGWRDSFMVDTIGGKTTTTGGGHDPQ